MVLPIAAIVGVVLVVGIGRVVLSECGAVIGGSRRRAMLVARRCHW
jgi:hypothetical protein